MSKFVLDHYSKHVQLEWERLDQPLCRIEYLSTLRLIDRYFPAKGRVCDIGSGPGRYAIELARRSYAVTLFELTPALLDRARAAFEEEGLGAEQFICGDAQDMNVLDDQAYDAALLLGPLYHVIDAAGRRRVLDELVRVLKPDGVAVVAYLNAWGILRTGLADFPARCRDADFLRSMLEEKVFEGTTLGEWTESYWATPPAALQEVSEAGLEVLSYAGAEGFVGGMRPIIEQLAEEKPEVYREVVKVAAEMSELPQYRDSTDHLHIVVRKKRRA